ncbi:hypothetical protein K443DRAFT_9995 [Laccaria amethystina LaAM-08-1]|uniref:Uncharacterized protein n=1 Tax=Laccaria amethystina LaAM-08-1 TaxID=1095629 RepID=A0A0C9WLK9_9AGAR|nr:hypothetical protein K443DRAFT_9995 [Laccaria amethystina LaAM-08-1]
MAPKRQQAIAAVPPVAVQDDEDNIYMLGPPNCDISTSDQPTTISNMVIEVMAECPAAVSKFRVSNPEILEKAAKEHERKAKAVKRGAPGVLSNTASDSEEGENKERDGKNKKKKSNTEDTSVEANDGEDNPTAIDLTLYVYVEKPLIPQLKGKPSESDKYIQKGPFKNKAMDTYSKFLVSISAVLPCPVLNIVEAKITWKCQTPQNSPSLPLGGETGYYTMIEALQPAERPPWDIENMEKVPEKTFDYGELDAHMGTTDDAIAQQQTHFNQVVGLMVTELKGKYPIRNHPLFPRTCIYTDLSTKWNWDLTEIHLNVWASHIATIKNVYAEAPTPVIVTPVVALPAPVAALPSTSSSIMELMILSMLQQQQAMMANKLLLVVPTTVPEPLEAAPAPAIASGSLTIPDVSLEDFCVQYHVDE